jgi:hypothetical protein
VVISNCNINNTRNGSTYTTWIITSTGEEVYTTGYGAGIILHCNTVTISDTVILNARVTTPPGYDKTVPFRGTGAGIYWEGTNSLTIRNSRLENCIANYEAGAIYPTSGYTLSNTPFVNCSP